MARLQRTVLILEANAEDAGIFRQYLEREPETAYRCHVASTAAQGLELCRSLRPDVILLDYRLPDITGLACLEALIAEHGRLAFAVVMVAGVGNEAVAVQALKLGAQDYLIKEYDIRQRLALAVSSAIEKLDLQRQIEQQHRVLAENNQQLQQALHAQQASSARLHMALQAARMATWEWDLATDQVRWGAGLEEMMKLPPGQFGGSLAAFEQLVHPDDLALVRQRLDQALRGDAPYEVEFRMRRPDGSLRWTATRGMVLRDERGAPIGMSGVDMDISERKQAEAVLSESEEIYRALVTATSDLIWRANASGEMQFISPLWHELTGQSAAELQGWGWTTTIHPDDIAQAMRLWNAALASRSVYENEFRVRVRDGGYRRFHGRGVPIVAPDGSVREWIGYSSDITERRQAEAALRVSEQRARVMWASASDAMALSDADGIILEANQAYCDLYGYSLEQVIGHSFAIIFPPDQRAWAIEQYRELMQTHTVLPMYEATIQRANGAERVVESRATLVATNDGQNALLSVIRDITERRQIENQLRRSEAQFKTLIENAPDIIARFDRQLRHLYVSPMVERVTGLPQSAFIGKTNRELGMPDAQCDIWDAQSTSVFQTGQPSKYEFAFPTPDGLLSYQATIVPEFSQNGVVETVLSITRDVTAYKQAEARLTFLADASKVLTTSLDYQVTLQQIARLSIPYLGDACIIDLVDGKQISDSVVAHIDPQQEDLLREICRQYPPALNSAHPVAQVLRNHQPIVIGQIVPELLAQIILDDRHRALVQRIPPKSCMLLPLMVRDRTIGVIGVYATQAPRRYTPEDRMVLEELARRAAIALDNAQLYQEARHAIREREAFLGIASHEVKNPLTTLLGRSQMLQRRLARQANSARDLEDIETIIEQSNRINRLLSELLDASQLESGQFTIQPAPLDLGSLIQHVVSEFNLAASDHTITYTQRAGQLAIVGDASRLEQVFHNLISNAVKYSPGGGTVTIEADADERRARVSISDQGLGIPHDALPNLFKRFYRVARDRAQQISGTGIGLFVVKEIVSSHGGTVEVSSTEGVGSTFTVYLPLAKL